MKYVVGLLAIISIVACKQTRQKEEPKSYFCSPQLEAFFSGADSLPVIEFEYDDSLSLIKERLARLIDTTTTTQDYFVFFKIKYTIDRGKSPIYLKVFIRNPFPAFLPPYCGFKNRLDIRINSIGQYLVEAEYQDTSNVKAMVIKHIKNYGKEPEYSDSPLKANTRIIWDYQTHETNFNYIIKTILSAYTQVLEQAAQTTYNKDFCQLTATQTDSLLVNYDFKLQLDYRELEYPEIDFILPLPKGSFKDLP